MNLEDQEKNKVGFFYESKDKQSFTRLCIAWYFWGICLPGSLYLLYVTGDTIMSGKITPSDGLTLLGFFIILQLGWIAPKALSKMNEVTQFIAELKQK